MSGDRIAQGVTYGDANYPFRYMYSISGGNSYANACSPDLPILQYSALHKEIPAGEVDYRGIYYCVAAWQKNCAETKNEFAEEICQSMNTSGEIRIKQSNGAKYYRVY